MANIFGFIINPMEWGLAHLALVVDSAGIAIILFTILVRLILAPLTITQLMNARAMSRLQPKVAELRKKHGNDKAKLSQETMALYKEHKVNPAMGCLPMLLQFPVLIGLFYALSHLGSHPGTGPVTSYWLTHSYHYSRAVYDLFHAKFLWLSNGLGQHDPLYILPLLAGATQWIQSRMMLQKTTDPQQQTMNTMMNFAPLMIIFFATRYASGLSLYWVTSTLIGIAIQYRITGWGLLPRPAAIFGRTAPARAAVSQRRATAASPRVIRSGNRTEKAPTDADIVLSDNGGNGASADGEVPSDVVPDKPASRPNGRQSSRRRSSHTRKGTRRRAG